MNIYIACELENLEKKQDLRNQAEPFQQCFVAVGSPNEAQAMYKNFVTSMCFLLRLDANIIWHYT